MKIINTNETRSPQPVITVKYCDTFLCKFIGLMFTKELKQNFGLVLADNHENRINTAIHMLFMNYDITALWVNKNRVIVDKALARKWHLFYISRKPAQYVIELHHSKYSEFSIGDQLVFIDEG